MGRKRVRHRKPKRELRASDFGDDPTIRRKHGEAARTHQSEPWEVAYQRRKKRLAGKLRGEDEEKKE